MAEGIELSTVFPCLEEERTVRKCVVDSLGFLQRHGVRSEVVVADYGSTDVVAPGRRGAGAQRGPHPPARLWSRDPGWFPGSLPDTLSWQTLLAGWGSRQLLTVGTPKGARRH